MGEIIEKELVMATWEDPRDPYVCKCANDLKLKALTFGSTPLEDYVNFDTFGHSYSSLYIIRRCCIHLVCSVHR